MRTFKHLGKTLKNQTCLHEEIMQIALQACLLPLGLESFEFPFAVENI